MLQIALQVHLLQDQDGIKSNSRLDIAFVGIVTVP